MRRRPGILRLAPGLTLVLLIGPVVAGLLGTLLPALSSRAAALGELLSWPGLGPALWLSVKTGVMSTVLALAITLLLIASLQGSRSFAALQHLLSPLLSVPHAAAALGLAFLIAPSGWVARALSPWATGWEVPPDLLVLNDPGGWALTLGLVAKEVPFLLLMALAALPQTDAARRRLQAQTLGAAPSMAFAVAVLPALYRQLRLPVYAVLAYGMTAVDMALILGPSRPPTLSAQVVVWMNDPPLATRGIAAAGAVLQLFAVLAVLALWRGGEVLARRLLLTFATHGLRGRKAEPALRGLALASGAGVAFVLLAGLSGLALWSVAGLWSFPDALPESWSLRIWAQAGDGLAQSTWTTLVIALSATAMALALTLACLEAEFRHALRPGDGALVLLYLPLLVPQVAFLPGLQQLALRLGVEGTPLAVAASHVVFVLPYVFLSLAAPWRAWDGRIALSAHALGATPDRVFWTLRLPMMLRAVLTAGAVGLAVSIGQYLPTLLIGGGRVETLTTEAVALSSGGNRRLIGAYALIQMILPALGFALALLLPALLFRNRRGMGVGA